MPRSFRIQKYLWNLFSGHHNTKYMYYTCCIPFSSDTHAHWWATVRLESAVVTLDVKVQPISVFHSSWWGWGAAALSPSWPPGTVLVLCLSSSAPLATNTHNTPPPQTDMRKTSNTPYCSYCCNLRTISRHYYRAASTQKHYGSSGYIMYVLDCTFLFSSLYADIALMCWILCSLSLDRARQSTSRAYSASFTLLASCSLSATHFSSICLFNWSRNSFLQQKEGLFLSGKYLCCMWCNQLSIRGQKQRLIITCILLSHCWFQKRVFAIPDDTWRVNQHVSDFESK